MKTTVKDLVKGLGIDKELATPQQVIDFLDEKYSAADNIDSNDFDAFVYCGEKAMYVFNHLFGKEATLTDTEISKYEIEKDDVAIEYLYDGDVDCEWTEDIDFFKEENTPYIACINKGYSDLKSFLNTLSIIWKETGDTIKLECFTTGYMGEYAKSGFEIDAQGSIKFYGPEFTIYGDEIVNAVYLFLVTFNCKSFEDIDALNVPINIEVDSEDEFEQFFEAAGFGK